jgi:hypothetical protein
MMISSIMLALEQTHMMGVTWTAWFEPETNEGIYLETMPQLLNELIDEI